MNERRDIWHARRIARDWALLLVAATFIGCGPKTPSTGDRKVSPDRPTVTHELVESTGDPLLKMPRSGTFGWVPITYSQTPRDSRIDFLALRARVHKAVTSELTAKGFSYRLIKPTFRVGFHVVLGRKPLSTTVSPPPGTDPSWLRQLEQDREYKRGTLLLDIVDPTAMWPIWRGMYHANIILEGPEAEMEAVKPLIREEMEGVMPLEVPMRVDMEAGKNWSEAH